MNKLNQSNLKLGIIAGGQLAKMLIQEASKWNITSYVLDSDENCPAAEISSHFVKGDLLSFESVYQFGKLVDLLTFEIENVNIDALKKLKSEGYNISPDPEILQLIQDKGLQKQFYKKHNIPTAPFTLFQSEMEILNSIKKNEIDFPFIQKVRKGGYDGRGVATINNQEDLHKLLAGASILENKIQIQKEISVIVARNKNKEIKCFPPVEMIFDSQANLLDKLICPASLSDIELEKIILLASKIAELLEIQGLLAIEFFIDKNGNIIVNEMAPRPHNSGHHTMECNLTSQYEQHLRAILNLKLGNTASIHPSVMLNLLGSPNQEGPVLYEGLTECLSIEGVKTHLYGKKITKPNRKMGHLTVIAPSLDLAVEKADQIKKIIKVTTCKKN